MEEKKLYPMQFAPLSESFAWGSISHQIADLGYVDSILKSGWLAGNGMGDLMDMFMDRITGERAFAFYGRQFPLGVKYIDVRGRMPLMVHPDDETAGPRFDFLGKSKFWYVLSAGPKACVSYGLAGEEDASSLYTGCSDGSIYDRLNNVRVKRGDWFHIKPGTVHSAEDVEILEISESSPMDFTLCNWGQAEESVIDETMGLTEALDFIDYHPAVKQIPSENKILADSDEMQVRKLELDESEDVNRSEEDGFVIYACVSGKASIQIADSGKIIVYDVNSGESVLVPAEMEEYLLVPHKAGTVLLEASVRKGAEPDAYINPSVGDSPEDGEYSEDDENYLN